MFIEDEQIEDYDQLESILRTTVPGVPLRFGLEDGSDVRPTGFGTAALHVRSIGRCLVSCDRSHVLSVLVCLPGLGARGCRDGVDPRQVESGDG